MAIINNQLLSGGGLKDPILISNNTAFDRDFKYVVAVAVASVGDTGNASCSMTYTGSGTKVAEATGIGDKKWMAYIYRIYKDCKKGDKINSTGYWQFISTCYGFE